jgi:microcin C transport system permease protein
VARRRFERFKKNRRGWWSLWLFIGLFILTLGGELIANDKPLVLSFRTSCISPRSSATPSSNSAANCRSRPTTAATTCKLIKQDGGWMLFPPIPFSDDTPNYDLTRPAPSPPSAVNWLGTDDQARDVLARVIFGTRVSMLFALALTAISA